MRTVLRCVAVAFAAVIVAMLALAKMMTLLIDCDKMAVRDVEQGLAHLKSSHI
jgi:hypothetical protein